ncbi:hypothetical protein L210DRAFT_3639566 [Boletus edulis BED1]|uniref:Vacuolar-sorting protein SNF7 n=1 Tax=Boletus edulis BED1 TaxID=1328754 RepID=A0AAD4GL05_BOLED|nr:hypothetical protein L210DRAFT_3639566 [Boletus edulis BED1]
MIEKKKDHLQKRIAENLKKAKANVVSNRAVAIKALRNNQQIEEEMEQLNGVRLQLEQNINMLESADLETMQVMRKRSDVLERVRGVLDQVDAVVASLTSQRELAREISETVSPLFDETELREMLAELEQAELDERLAAGEAPKPVEDDEEAQLRELQAALGM